MATSLRPPLATSTHWTLRLLLVGVGLSLVSVMAYWAWASQPPRRVKVVDVISKPGVNSVFIDSQPIQAGAELMTGQQLITLPEARLGLQQADEVVARLADQSSLTLEKDCFQLGEGQVVISSTQGCLGAAIVRSQQGVYVLERVGTLGAIRVLAGEIEVAVPSNPSLQPLTLKANQKVSLSLTGDEIGPIRLMLPGEVAQIINSELFQGFQTPLTNQQAIANLPLPTPSPKPTMTPAPSVVSKPVPPVVKAVAAPAASASSSGARFHPSVARSFKADDSSDEYDSEQPDYTSPRTYNRVVRRRRSTPQPSYEQYAYRRRSTRSPYSGSSYRRRTPTYSPPSHPAPANDLPSVPEIPPTVEGSSPTNELPPVMPPGDPMPNPELPPPAVVEPPLAEPMPK